MTGYASHTFELPCREGLVSATIHIKVVNGRFFEPTFRLPHALIHLEPVLAKQLRDALVRGTVYCTIHIGTMFALTSRPMVSSVAMNGYIEALEQTKKRLNLTDSQPIDPVQFVGLPHVVEFVEDPIEAGMAERIVTVFEQAVRTLLTEREREGRALAADISIRLDRIYEYVEQIVVRAQEVLEQKRERLVQSLKELSTQIGCSQEVYEAQVQHAFSQLDKLDVHEEIVRLRTHSTNARTILAGTELEKGKRLDFTTQEMFRETNTIGAKCADAQLGGLVINTKVELEKIREQVQNLV
jgi:uncharacterized protein (TIGR00255 family)